MNNVEKPDVDAIVAQIKRNIEEAGNYIPEPSADETCNNGLEYNLRAANIYVQTRGGGSNFFVKLVRRVILRMLGLSMFHENIVKVLNELNARIKNKSMDSSK